MVHSFYADVTQTVGKFRILGSLDGVQTKDLSDYIQTYDSPLCPGSLVEMNYMVLSIVSHFYRGGDFKIVSVIFFCAKFYIFNPNSLVLKVLHGKK